jgi:hypothetical protein
MLNRLELDYPEGGLDVKWVYDIPIVYIFQFIVKLRNEDKTVYFFRILMKVKFKIVIST